MPPCEFRGDCLSKNRATERLDTRDDRCVLFRPVACINRRAVRGRDVGGCDYILHADRNAGEGALTGNIQFVEGQAMSEGLKPRFDILCALEAGSKVGFTLKRTIAERVDRGEQTR